MKNLFLLVFLLIIFNNFSQNCNPSSASIDLDINNIRAILLNGGDMWWNGVSSATYEFPKLPAGSTQTPSNILFAGGIWLSALDENDNLKLAAQTFRNQGHDFWPGPIVFGENTIADIECSKFDRFFPVLRTELDAHINAISNSETALNLSSISINIKEWPGKGNQYLLNTYNMDIVDEMAPFQDCNANGYYDPENGDYPLMKGDQSVFWVINDIGNHHSRSNGEPLLVEIHNMAYAYITNNEVNDATFYDYKIIKKTSGNLHDLYFSQFVDPDIRDALDDFVGCDTVKNYAFAYDDNSNSGSISPIVVTQFLKTPNNKNMSSFIYFTNGGNTCLDDPDLAPDFRNLQLGLSKDGTAYTIGGGGCSGTVSTKFIFPGNPSSANEWSECSAGNFSGDRRYVMTTGPYNLNATDELEFTLAVMAINTNPNTYNGCPDKTTLINPVVHLVKNFTSNVNDNPYTCKSLGTGITDFKDEKNLVSIFPNPSNGKVQLRFADDFTVSKIEVLNALGSIVNFDLNESVLSLPNSS